MALQDRFPSSNNFFYFEHQFDVEVPENPDFPIKVPSSLRAFSPDAVGIKPLPNNDSDRKTLKVGSFTLRAESGSIWNVRNLLSGGWGTVEMGDWATQVHPRSQQNSNSTILPLTSATLLAVESPSPSGTARARVAYLVPRSQFHAGAGKPFGVDAAISQWQTKVPDLLEAAIPKDSPSKGSKKSSSPAPRPGDGPPTPQPAHTSPPPPGPQPGSSIAPPSPNSSESRHVPPPPPPPAP
jgi:hypothetical protein